MTIKTVIIALYCILLCIGCTTVNVSDSALIREREEGFLFASIMTDVPVTVSLFSRNTSQASGPFAHAAAVFENLHTGENFIMIKLPAGRYTFKYLYYQSPINAFEFKDAPFEIEAGTITYTGRLSLYTEIVNAKTRFIYAYKDVYTDHQSFLEKEYPRIKNRYPVRNKTPDLLQEPAPAIPYSR